MRVVTVTMIRNEQDIIETFVRYHVGLVDEMVILDNGSVDQTGRILSLLRQEGLPLRLHFNSSPAFVQSSLVTQMVREAFESLGADIVVPLDVDEFLSTATGRNVRQDIESLPPDLVSEVQWVTYVPTPSDDYRVQNPLLRITCRRATQFNHDGNVVVPASVWQRDPQLTIGQGSHCVRSGTGERLPVEAATSGLSMLHFPLRSPEQMRAKCLVGWIANLARPTRVLFDWLSHYHLAKDGTPSLESLQTAALTYNVLDRSVKPGLVREPADLAHAGDVRLRYTPSQNEDVLRLVLALAEDLADQVSVSLGRSGPQDSPLSDEAVFSLIEEFRTIPGWLSHREAATLFRVVHSLDSHAPTLCEIGSWVGRSSYVLARALETLGGRGVLYCVDPLDGTGDPSSEAIYKRELVQMDQSLAELFWRNLSSRGVDQYVRLIQARCDDAEDRLPSQLDMLFIDGNHSYAAVRSDFLRYGPRIRRGGYVAFHDVGSARFTGPKQVVETCIVPNKEWDLHTLVDELFVARRA